MHRFSVKPEIFYGEDALKSLCKVPAKRVWLILDPYMQEHGYHKLVEEVFAGQEIAFGYFSNILPDPSLELIVDGIVEILKFEPDLVVAIGGGSAIDEAKAIVYISSLIRASRPRFAVIPTTSGTGSEVTNVSVITVDGQKHVLVKDEFLPDIAILDVQFTKSLPLPILADTAIDAFTHALEAYVSKNGSDCADAFAEKAMKLIFQHLRQIMEYGDNLVDRTRLHNASCIAGMAFTNASLGINHSMAHALGSQFHIPHGRANAAFLGTVLAYNAQKPYVKSKIIALCREMGLLSTPGIAVEAFTKEIDSLLEVCGLASCVAELGIAQQDYESRLDALANAAMADRCTQTNPVSPTFEEMRALFQKAYRT